MLTLYPTRQKLQRSLCAWLTVVALFSGITTSHAGDPLVIMTSYPQETISLFEAAFETAYPQYQLEIIWRPTVDALSYLKDHRQQVDVYWTPARSNFLKLAQDGFFEKLNPAWIHAPSDLHGTQLNDPQGYYAATEIAGLGMVYQARTLLTHHMVPPKDWSDLSRPEYFGQVAFPLPSKVGFAGGLLVAMLEGKHWKDYWSLLTKLSINAKFMQNGASFVTDEVASGRIAVGITMDFFATSAISKGADLTYVYPPVVAYSPAHIAIFQDAPHKQAARDFAAFTLSTAGQKLLFASDIRKLPVDPQVYVDAPANYFNPYSAHVSEDGTARSLIEQTLLNHFFEATLFKNQALLQAIHFRLQQALYNHPNQAELINLQETIQQPLLTEEALFSEDHIRLFKLQQQDASAKQAVEQLERAWTAHAKQHYQTLLDKLQSLSP